MSKLGFIQRLSRFTSPSTGGRQAAGKPDAASARPSRPDSSSSIPLGQTDQVSRAIGSVPRPLDRQTGRLLQWTDRQIAAAPGKFFVPKVRPVEKASEGERKLNAETTALFKKTFQSFLWTGFECSNPLLGEARWDQNEVAGLYDPGERKRQLEIMRQGVGIDNARIALPNHKMFSGTVENLTTSWQPFDEIYADFKRSGAKVSVDLMHFGLPDAFHRPEDRRHSDYLHPEWPAHFAQVAGELIRRHPDIPAFTLINEPFVTNNFSAGHWNEAVGGNEAFIERALLMGKAAVGARAAIEAELHQTGARKIFLHNESCEWRSDDQEFNAFRRFLTSDLILGGDWLMSSDFKQTDMYRWMASQYDQSPAGQKKLETMVTEIRDAHLNFAEKYGKPMKADTVFGMDYYVTCEAGPGVTHSVDEYPSQAQNTRKGLYEMGQDYWSRYRLPLFHAETNMREDRAETWMTQQLIELGGLMKSGVPVLGATWYSLMDQVGWENGMNGEVLSSVQEAKDKNRLNPIGLVSLEGHDPRASAVLLQGLGKELAGR